MYNLGWGLLFVEEVLDVCGLPKHRQVFQDIDVFDSRSNLPFILMAE